MKLEVGMYCYNKINRKSGIGKIVGFRENNNSIIKYVSDIAILSIGNIVASYKLIDLIDKGDYVNGYKVLWVYNTEMAKSGPLYVAIDNHDDGESRIMEEDIKDIVTKEQFNSMKYVVKED